MIWAWIIKICNLEPKAHTYFSLSLPSPQRNTLQRLTERFPTWLRFKIYEDAPEAIHSQCMKLKMKAPPEFIMFSCEIVMCYIFVRYRRGEPRVRVSERVGPALREASGHVRARHGRAAVSASRQLFTRSFSQLSPTSCPLKHSNWLPPEVSSAPDMIL